MLRFTHSGYILADICLISPVVEILLGKHIFMILRGHVRSQDSLCDGKSDCIRRSIPSVIGSYFVENVMLLHKLHQSIIGAVCKVNINHGNRNSAIDNAVDLVHEICCALFHHAVAAECSGFSSRNKRRINGKHNIRCVLFDNRSAGRNDMFFYRLSNRLILITWNRIFFTA